MGSSLNPVFRAIQNSIAPKTWTDYSVAWKKWKTFNDGSDFLGSRPTESSILAFLCSLLQDNFSINHISKTMAGVSFFFKLQGLPACNSFFSVRQALKGLRKGGSVQDTRRPITIEVLSRLCLATPWVCTSEYEALLFHAAFVLMFFAALRISEMLPSNKHSFDGLLVSEVLFAVDKVQIFIRKSKTDLVGKGCWLNLLACGDSVICPVLILNKYFSGRPKFGSHFLVHLDSSPLTKFQFSSVLKLCFSHLGLSSFKFSSHSFRIGAATEAARLGLSDSVIMRLGRWESSRFNIYIRPNLSL